MYVLRPLQKSLARYLRFPYLVAAMLLAIVYVHGVRVEVNPAKTPAAGRAEASGSGRAQLASFSHPASHSKKDVQTLRTEYIDTYADVAVAEMRAFGIPASITLAQGLLESVAGTSRLATQTNNHFGMKCFSKKCAPGHCRNFDDDHHKDFFRAYAHPRESFRAHSKFLRDGKRYAGLFKLRGDDYEGWARGLSKAGYATDPKYADKLISLVERYELDRFDE